MAISGTLRARYGLKTTAGTKANFDRRIRLIVADNERGKRIVVKIARTTFTLPETEPNGHTRGEIRLDAGVVEQHSSKDSLAFTAILRIIHRSWNVDLAGVNLVREHQQAPESPVPRRASGDQEPYNYGS